jgi:TolA-binding protein
VCVVAIVTALAGLATPAASGAMLTPERQYAFAEELAKLGDGQLAILEFRRFVFMFPQDPRVPDARFAIAQAYLEQSGNVAAARRELSRLVEEHPRTEAADRARQLDTLVEANKEADFQPLLLFFGARGARQRGDSKEALRQLDTLLQNHPRALLAPDAVLTRAQVLEGDKRLDDAIAAYAELPARYPNSANVPRALLGQATATEARDGAKAHVLDLYRQVATRYPNTPYATQAQERLAALQKQVDTIERQFRPDDVKPFKVTRSGYFANPNLYEVQIEIGDDLSEREIKATLEDALLRHYELRRDPTHLVRVTASYAQLRKRAGVAAWTPKQKPTYDVEKIKGKDRLRGFLDDLRK